MLTGGEWDSWKKGTVCGGLSKEKVGEQEDEGRERKEEEEEVRIREQKNVLPKRCKGMDLGQEEEIKKGEDFDALRRMIQKWKERLEEENNGRFVETDSGDERCRTVSEMKKYSNKVTTGEHYLQGHSSLVSINGSSTPEHNATYL